MTNGEIVKLAIFLWIMYEVLRIAILTINRRKCFLLLETDKYACSFSEEIKRNTMSIIVRLADMVIQLIVYCNVKEITIQMIILASLLLCAFKCIFNCIGASCIL